jgi:hypothetical protein
VESGGLNTTLHAVARRVGSGALEDVDAERHIDVDYAEVIGVTMCMYVYIYILIHTYIHTHT